MARPIWSGSISFGLVNVPVRLHTAVRDRQVHFHMMSADGACRLRRKLYCPDTGKEYDFGETARGFEVAPEQYVIIEDEELERLKPEQGHAIEIQEFVDLHEVDPVFFDRPYYVSPDKGGDKGYRLLVEAIEQSGKVGIARFVMRQRQHLAVLRVRDHALVLETMHYQDEVAEVSEIDLPKRVSVNERERDLAVQIIESMATTFESARYHDEYREQLEELIQQRAEGVEETALAEAPPEPGGQVIDLMEALKKSLARRAGHPAAGGDEPTPARGKRGASRRKSARKAPAKAAKASASAAKASAPKAKAKAQAQAKTKTKTSPRAKTQRSRQKKSA
jgi:DNA end-binding protein Ku